MNPHTIRGVTFAVLAAFCFGVTTPILATFQGELPPFAVSGWISVGMIAASAVSASFGRNGPDLGLDRLPLLGVSSVLGAVLAPALLTFGLARANGVAACLLLNFEAVFTAALGILIYRERLGWRFSLGIFAVTVGAIVLMSDNASDPEQMLGLAAVAGATALWASDNALNRSLAPYDSSQVMLGKGLVGASVSLVWSLGSGDRAIAIEPLVVLVACGLFGYGGMERFYLLAQRTLGVARTSSIFAVSPFFGAAVALFNGIPASPSWIVAGVIMGFGVFLHATDSEDPVEAQPEPQPEQVCTGSTPPPDLPRGRGTGWR